MTTPAYPRPREDDDNRAFLEAWRSGRLLLQHCGQCQKSIFYPRPMCPHCWSTDLSNVAASGRGKIVSYSVIWRPNDPAFNDEVPILLAEVALEEGALMIARIIDTTPDRLKSGLAVVLPPPEVGSRYPLPVFRLAAGG
jgi:uncharacterized OB-fold protein